MLLYGRERQHHFEDAWIQGGRFIGDNKADIFDHIDVHAPLPRAVDGILLFLKKHAVRAADFSEIRRKDLWRTPVRILREVAINALIHADYSHRGSPLRVAFFDNRIEIESPGLPLPGLTIEDIKQGVSQIRNPVIARVFRELELVEEWGSGIPGIFRIAKEENLPEPTIEELPWRVRFAVPFAEILPLTREQSRRGGEQSAPVTAPVSSYVEKLLHLLVHREPLGSEDIREAFGLKSRRRLREAYLAPALSAGLIQYTLPEKPNSRLQKYRLTDAGRKMTSEG